MINGMLENASIKKALTGVMVDLKQLKMVTHRDICTSLKFE